MILYLIRILQHTHPDYKFSFVPIIIGTLGTVPKGLHENIRQLDFNKKESNDISNQFNKKPLYARLKYPKPF